MTLLLSIAALSMTLLASSVTANNYFIAAEAPQYNNKVVGNLLEKVASLRGPGEAYAVFDWDNTCLFGDVAYATAYYQVENLNLRFAPIAFERLFSMGYNSTSSDACFVNGTNSVIGQDVNGTDVTLATAINKTLNDYEVVYNAYIAPTYNLTKSSASASLEQIKTTDEYVNFRAKMAFLLRSIWIRDGGDPYSECAMKVGMGVLPFLTVGMTEVEVKSLVRSSTRWHLAQELKTLSYTSTGELTVTGPFYKGLRLFNGQESIMRSLRAAGVDVYIISASPELYVRAADSLLGLGYMIPNDHVFGVRFKTDDAGSFTTEYEDNYPITWGPGKATIVNSILKPRHCSAAPIYASGDSDGDCDMFNTVRDGVVFTNNRLSDNSTCINSFYQKACEYFNTTEPSTSNAYLLQGQDQEIGSWITSGFTTEDGVTYESGVTDYDGCMVYQFLDM